MGYLGRYKLTVILIVLFSILATLFLVMSPYVSGQITTSLFEGVKTGAFDFTLIIELIALLCTLYIISSVFDVIEKFMMARVASKAMEAIRNDIDKKMHVMKLNYYDTHTHGEILSTITNDVDSLNEAVANSFTQLISAAIKILGIIVMMFITDWKLALISVATIPLTLFVSKGIMAKGEKKYEEQQALISELNGIIEENYNGQAVIQAFNYQERSIEAFNQKNVELQSVSQSAETSSGAISPISSVINNIGYVICALIGCLFAIKGNMSVGNVQAILQYAKNLSEPYNTIAGMTGTLSAANAAAKRIFALIDTEEEIPDVANPKVPATNKGIVEFKHVAFGYTPDHLLMKDVNISVKPGQKCAVVGPTGAGKTTLINLLMRFYEINGGSITVDGMDTREMTREELRKRFGMVLQDTWLFEGTIIDNLGYGGTNIPKQRILEASKTACTDSFIRTLPGGYDMVLDKGAENISQGERQMLTIARAMATDPEIMILDEATSNVDTHTEVMIQSAMKKLMQGRTSFVIAHRLSTIKDSDVILYMENGDIKEFGSHDELMTLGGKYAALYNSQFA